MVRKKKSFVSKKPAGAAKKRGQTPSATKATAEVTPEVVARVNPKVVAEKAIKTEAKRARRKPPVATAESIPAPKRRSLTLAERLAVIAGVAFLAVGIAGVLQRPDTSVPDTSVKAQNIPMTLDDFKDDPAIQHAIKKQLGEQDTSAPTPQQQQAESLQNAGSSLQTPGGNLQAQ